MAAEQDMITAEVAAIVDDVSSQHALPVTTDPSVSLADRGMTSMAMVDLMMSIEARFDVTIPRAELTAANFKSIASIASLVERLKPLAA